MSGEKTEKPTSKRLRDERKKGNVHVSKDLFLVATIVVMFYSLRSFLPTIYNAIKDVLYFHLAKAAEVKFFSDSEVFEVVIEIVKAYFVSCLPLLFIAMLVPVSLTMYQTKMLFATEALKPNFKKLDPIKGMKKFFSLKSVVEVIKNSIKISILLVVVYNYFMDRFLEMPLMLEIGIEQAMYYMQESIITLVMMLAATFFVIAVADHYYQKYEFTKQLKMSKHDIKEEHKQMEGDPKIKGKIKEKQRQLGMARMMQEIPNADVVIKNPTHYAVALKYDINNDIAPIVIAKGADSLAFRIIEIATEKKVCVLENVALTRAIYATTEVGEAVPEDCYSAVAEVLAFVYNLENKKINGL